MPVLRAQMSAHARSAKEQLRSKLLLSVYACLMRTSYWQWRGSLRLWRSAAMS